MLKVQVNYYASARTAAGAHSEAIALPDGATLEDLVARLNADHPGRLEKVLTVASFLINGVATTDHSRALPDGAQVDVLPPFAGG